MARFINRNQRGVSGQWEVDPRESETGVVGTGVYECKNDIRDKIGLELVQIDVQRSIEAERSSNRGDYLGNQSIQIGEAW